ncbi:MAG: carboxypeptidase-like regulatory domain-containing protein [Acidobacteriota bacterium]
MQNIFIFRFILFITLSIVLFNVALAQDEIVIKKIFKVRSLSGSIENTNGDALENAVIEQLSRNWGKTIESTMTNSGGFFTLPERSERVYCLRVKKQGFETLLIRVAVNKRAKKTLVIRLPFSN